MARRYDGEARRDQRTVVAAPKSVGTASTSTPVCAGRSRDHAARKRGDDHPTDAIGSAREMCDHELMIATGGEHHFHASCESCGEVIELDVELRELAIMHLMKCGWRVRDMNQTWCPACAIASLEEAPPTSRRGVE
jgi:hypothetical protein